MKHTSDQVSSLSATDNYIHNIPLAFDGENWTGEVYWPRDEDVLDFYAYYPYDESADNPLDINLDLWSASPVESQGAVNPDPGTIMIGTAEKQGYTPDETVKFSFTPAVALIEVVITGHDLSTDRLEIELHDLRTGIAINLGTSTAVTQQGVNSIEMQLAQISGSEYTYRTFVPEQTLDAGKVLFTVNYAGDIYADNPLESNLPLKAGEIYSYTQQLVPVKGISGARDMVAFAAQWNETESITDQTLRRQRQEDIISQWSNNGRADGVIYLLGDMDMASVADFTPVGWRMTDDPDDIEFGFWGTFDGQGYTISNFTLNRSDEQGDNVGFFGIIHRGTVRNINFEDVRINSRSRVGTIAGYNNSGTISDCNITRAKINTTDLRAAGVLGVNYEGKVENCKLAEIEINGDGTEMGGVVGMNHRGFVIGCELSGSLVYTSRGGTAGGIVGNHTGAGGEIRDCKVTDTEVKTDNMYAGGIAGFQAESSIYDCTVSNCKVEAADYDFYAGGISGCITTTIHDVAEIIRCSVVDTDVFCCEESGGIAGWNEESIISDCVVEGGSVRADFSAGGIVGNNMGRVINSTVSNASVSAENLRAGGIAGQHVGYDSRIENCTVHGDGYIRAVKHAGGIAGYMNSAVLSACEIYGYDITTGNGCVGGIAGENHFGTIVASKVIGSRILAGGEYAGGIVGNNKSSFVAGCISSPESIAGESAVGTVAGGNSRYINRCYWAEGLVAGNKAVGDDEGGTVIDGGSFDRSAVRAIDNFFTMGDAANSPLDEMNYAVQGMGSAYGWAGGTAESSWYPVLYKF